MNLPHFTFDGDDLCLDFLNTLRTRSGVTEDLLASGHDVLDWLEEAGAADAEHLDVIRRSPPGSRVLLEEARRLREGVLALVRCHQRAIPAPPAAVFVVNRVLTRGTLRRELTWTENGLCVEEHLEGAGLRGLLASVAQAAAELACGRDGRRIRQCADPDCDAWFYDRSKNGSRRWCSMARCGNRAKVAAHYRRQRDAERE